MPQLQEDVRGEGVPDRPDKNLIQFAPKDNVFDNRVVYHIELMVAVVAPKGTMTVTVTNHLKKKGQFEVVSYYTDTSRPKWPLSVILKKNSLMTVSIQKDEPLVSVCFQQKTEQAQAIIHYTPFGKDGLFGLDGIRLLCPRLDDESADPERLLWIEYIKCTDPLRRGRLFRKNFVTLRKYLAD